ncbi:MAG: hypothetical protein LUE98_13010 [Tannerellaceae bacterium]|nr:hypothetical protein [Tannerellaceae bacterium]
MKSLGLSIIALLLCTTISFAKGKEERFTKVPFAASTEKLSKYLELTPAQKAEVASINEFFIELQKESLRSSSKNQYKRMQYALVSNLKLMKETLSAEQYRKYVVLLNITNNNNERKVYIDALPDSYLAYK